MYILPLISTIFIVISAILVALGWYQIAKKNVQAHIKLMIYAAISATLFFIFYVSRTIFIGNTAFGGPETVSFYYKIFLLFHIVLSTTGAIMGILTIYYGFKKKFEKHRKIGPYTSVVWLATAFTGVMVYLLLYVLYEPGETTNMIRAIFGT